MNEIAKSSLCVPLKLAQIVRKDLERNKLWDCSRKLVKISDDTVAIPVLYTHQSDLSTVLEKWPAAEVREAPVVPSVKAVMSVNKNGQKLTDIVRTLLLHNNLVWEDKLLSEIPKKWEKHGDLIILPSSAFTSPVWSKLDISLWETVASALSCQRLARHSIVADDGFRSPQVSMLLGDHGQVMHIDNGIKYSFDVTKCMFSSGNITEKMRVASWDCSKEIVVDLYAGIGYFTLPYLVHAKAVHVHACEWNPDAVEALRNNLSLNRVNDRCTVHSGDNRKLSLTNVADRVNLGLIPSSEDGWCVAVRVLKDSGGVLHIHQNVTVSEETTRNNPTNLISSSSGHSGDETCEHGGINNISTDVICDKYKAWAWETCHRILGLLLSEKSSNSNWLIKPLHLEKVKSYAPRIDHVVLDVKCMPYS